jgi:hypothetical protein
MMGLIFKLIAVLTALATTLLVAFESGRRGLIIISTILGVIKLIVLLAFFTLLALIIYLLLTSPARPAREEPAGE